MRTKRKYMSRNMGHYGDKSECQKERCQMISLYLTVELFNLSSQNSIACNIPQVYDTVRQGWPMQVLESRRVRWLSLLLSS